MGRFSFTYLVAKKKSYDDVKKKFDDGGAIEEQKLGAASPHVPEVSAPAPFPPLIITSIPKRPESRQSSTAHSGYRGVVGPTKSEELKVDPKIHNKPGNAYPLKDQSFGLKGTLGGHPGEDEMFFDAQTDFEQNSADVIVITDVIGTDNSSSPELTDSSSTDSELSTIRIIITPPAAIESTPLLEALYGGQSNMSTLSISSLYSTTSLTTSATGDTWLDPELLMPPCPENLLDRRRQRKAREHREVKKWLVAFLNSKGAQFPAELRRRVMEIYRIDESELAPSIISQFRENNGPDERLPEGLADALHMIEGEHSDKQLLRILRAFFHSQVQEMTPPGPRKYGNNAPGSTSTTRMHGPYPEITRTRPKPRRQIYANPSHSRSSQVTRSKSFTKHLSYTIRDPAPKSKSKNNPKSLIKIAKQKKWMEGKQPPGNLSRSAAQTRANRNRILKGTFGAIREVFGGKVKSRGKGKLKGKGISKDRSQGRDKKGRRLSLFGKKKISTV